MTTHPPPDSIWILIGHGTNGIAAGADVVASVLEEGMAKAKGEGRLDKDYKLIRSGDRGIFKGTIIDLWIPGQDRFTYQFVDAQKAKRILDDHIIGGVPIEEFRVTDQYSRFFDGQTRIVLQNCGEIDPEDMAQYIQRRGYEGLKRALEMSPDTVIDEVRSSRIRGRGGAGFPVGEKWDLARKASNGASNGQRYIICNAYEGDPGAFMDLSVLEGDPYSVIEGVTIAAYALGATKGIVYCNAEYQLAISRVRRAIETATEHGYLGEGILGTNFDLEITIEKGPGAFVCGEETAQIASIEGKRGMPHVRPPYPSSEGLWGRPTIVNNVESLATIPRIMREGNDWFRALGVENSAGTKVLALAGKVKNTGLIEVPMGTTIKDVIYGPGGGMLRPKLDLKAVQIGGPSGGCLPASLLETPIEYDALMETGAIMGSGGMIVMDESSCMVDIARFFLTFSVNESCGKCVPCREGLKKMLGILERITKGQGNSKDMDTLGRLAQTIKDTSLCGLGRTAPNPVLTTLRYFLEEYKAHINDRRCPARVCTDLLRFEVDDNTCTKCGLCHRACPSGAIEWERGKKARIVKEKCIKCRSCIQACNFKAIG